MPVGEHGSGGEMQSNAGLDHSCVSRTSGRYLTLGLCGWRPHHHPASQHPGVEPGHGMHLVAISDTCSSAPWHLCSVVLVSGWGESVATSPEGNHLSMSKAFPMMPLGRAALMVKTVKTVGIFACCVYVGGRY